MRVHQHILAAVTAFVKLLGLTDELKYLHTYWRLRRWLDTLIHRVARLRRKSFRFTEPDGRDPDASLRTLIVLRHRLTA